MCRFQHWWVMYFLWVTFFLKDTRHVGTILESASILTGPFSNAPLRYCSGFDHHQDVDPTRNSGGFGLWCLETKFGGAGRWEVIHYILYYTYIYILYLGEVAIVYTKMTITWLWFDAKIESFFLSAPSKRGRGIPLDSGFRGEWKVAGCHCGVLDAYCQQHHGAGRATLKLKGRKLPEIVASKKCWMEVFGRWKSELSMLFHTSPHAVVSCRCPCISFSFQSMYAKGYVHRISDWIKTLWRWRIQFGAIVAAYFFKLDHSKNVAFSAPNWFVWGGHLPCCAPGRGWWAGQGGGPDSGPRGLPVLLFLGTAANLSGCNDNPHLHPVAGHALISIDIWYLISDRTQDLET